jgi:tetratricopeptide (TPR) repeat protein
MWKKLNIPVCLLIAFNLVFLTGALGQKKPAVKTKSKSKKGVITLVKSSNDFGAVEIKRKAEICFGQKNYQCSIEKYSRLVEIGTNDYSIYKHRGLSYLALSSDFNLIVGSVLSNNTDMFLDKAIEDFNSAIKLKPDLDSLYYSRAIAYSAKTKLIGNQKDLMMQDLTKTIDLSGDNPNYYKTRGYFYYYYKGELAKAVTDLEKAISLNLNDDDIYYKLGEIYSATLIKNPILDYEKAIENYTKAIKLKPKQIDYYSSRADTAYEAKMYDLAIADYSTLIELQPNERNYQKRAEFYFKSDDYKNAVKDFTKAIELLNDLYYLYEKRGKAFLKLKLYDDSLRDFDHIIKNGKSAACNGYNGRGDVFFAQNKYNEALENYSNAIDLCEYNIEAFKSRSILYRKLGKTDLAEEDLKKVLEIIEKTRIELERVNKIVNKVN